MLEIVVGLTAGFVLLLVSTEVFVRGAIGLTKLLHWSPLVVGMTIMAIGTSMPELVVSVWSAFKGDTGLAVGNIVGSNIVNIFLIFGLGVALGKIRIGTTKTPKNVLMMLVATIGYVIWYYGWGGNPGWAIYFLAGAVVFTFLEIDWAMWGQKHEDAGMFSKKAGKSGRGSAWMLVIAIVGVAIGGIVVVKYIQQLSLILGWTSTFLGLTLSAIATSMPELLVTVFSEKEHQDKLVVGNIVGSNVYNLLLVGGLAGLFGGRTSLAGVDWVFFLAAAVLAAGLVLGYRGRSIPRWWAGVMLAAFIGYIVTSAILSAG